MGSRWEIVDSVVDLLWPTRFLALGSPDLSMVGEIILVLTNSVLFIFVGAVCLAVANALRVSPLRVFPAFLVIPVGFELLYSGFDSRFVEWAPFFVGCAFYYGVGLAGAWVASREAANVVG
jgi:hypothetical protein